MPENNKTDPDDSPKHDEDEKDSQRGLGMIIGVGIVVLLIVILVGAVFVDSQKIRFVTEFSLTVALATLVAVQAYIYRKQWKAMQESLTETQTIVTQNAQLVKAAQDTVTLTERGLRIGSRAYFFVWEATLESPINSGQYPLLKVVFKNSGKTPAFKHRVRLEQGFFGGDALEKARKGIMPDMRPMSGKGLGIVGPDSYTTNYPERQSWKSTEDEELAIKGEIVFYVWGLICYSDIFGEEHSSKFSLFAKNPHTTSLSFGMFGNELEDEEAERDEQEQTK